ncbi:MAG: sigma-70 family RNA polymerase sigma factor [Bacteroidaceae bacterium]|nr:sigma-70 family RNA polymerase sigma factor [Bacteroidaceae bacterium]
MTSEDLTEAFRAQSDRLFRVAYYILESETDAEDAVQDLFLKLWSGRDRLDTVVNFNAYCTTLMKNLCIDRIRKETRMQTVPAETGFAENRMTEDEVIGRETLERVLKAIDRLPRRQQEVIRMYVFEEMSYNEISEKTGMSNLTLRVLLSNARKSLRMQI